jgi:hypothetical protein
MVVSQIQCPDISRVCAAFGVWVKIIRTEKINVSTGLLPWSFISANILLVNIGKKAVTASSDRISDLT